MAEPAQTVCLPRSFSSTTRTALISQPLGSRAMHYLLIPSVSVFANSGSQKLALGGCVPCLLAWPWAMEVTGKNWESGEERPCPPTSAPTLPPQPLASNNISFLWGPSSLGRDGLLCGLCMGLSRTILFLLAPKILPELCEAVWEPFHCKCTPAFHSE